MPDPARLLDVVAAAEYLGGISTWSIRALVTRGELVPVRLPSCRRAGEPSRRLVFDRKDLDALIDKWKGQSTGAPNEALSAASVKGWQLKPNRTRSKVAS